MKTLVKICTLSFALVLPGLAADARLGEKQQPHARAYALPGHDPIGQPGSENKVTRTVEISIKETAGGDMVFEPDAIHIESGAVVRFVISNLGAMDHEFFLGSFDEIAEHQLWMRDHPDMQHDDPNAISISSGQTDELVWEFSEMTNLEFVCLFPGHRQAGMWGVIMVHNHLAPKSQS